MRERCAAALAAGYRRVQLKVGTGVREDVERIEACVEALADAELVIVGRERLVDAGRGGARGRGRRATST